MRLQLTLHAKTRMQQRRITEEEIRWVLLDPDDIEQYNGETMVTKADPNRLLKIVYTIVDDDTYRIITVIAQRRRRRR
ncbi:MAG: DUF4258 domain-containing protein [Caldilineaceae bacterium]|nr:DUF4258 domain-containing protein [Caldilineaceae bacterium]